MEEKLANQKIAIVCDWLYGGGAERVVLELHRIFPDAPIYASYCSDEWRQKLDSQVITGYLQYSPFKQLRKFLPILRMRWFRKLKLSDFGMVLSVTGNGEAKFVTVKKPGLHICYCNTPTHFYWRHYDEYLASPGFRPYWLVRLALRLLVKPLRQRDYAAAQKVDYFMANSNHIKADIKHFYDRDATTLHPPVDTERFSLTANSSQLTARQGFVTMGRQTPYKKTDLIIEACNQLNLPLTVIGRGPEHAKLVELAGPTITFKTNVTDEQMPIELAQAEAFIFAAHEDFGVAPVEAMATGTPVIAFRAGGALDYVVEGMTGLFFDTQSVESIVQALQDFKNHKFAADDIKQAAEAFSVDNFHKNLQNFINTL